MLLSNLFNLTFNLFVDEIDFEFLFTHDIESSDIQIIN